MRFTALQNIFAGAIHPLALARHMVMMAAFRGGARGLRRPEF
jgi:hypothetical protein